MNAPRVRSGESYPLGATFDGDGTNFSVFSRTAQRVELCLFDETGAETRIELPEMTATVTSLAVATLSLPQIMHYFLDAFIWRFDGSNPNLRELVLGPAEGAGR